MDVHAATLKALDILQKSPKGYFLVVEWDAHTDDPREGLQNIVDFDKLIAEVEKRVDLNDTLLLFTAEHYFGLQVDGGQRGEDRQRVLWGKSVSVRVNLGGGRIIKKKQKNK